jgi:hypothetical protein
VESSTEQALRLNQVFKPELDTKVLVDLLVEQQLGLQNSSTNTNYLERLNLNETHLYQEPNTPEESYQVSKPELDFKVLVEPYTEQQLGHQSTSTNTFRRVLVNFTDLTKDTSLDLRTNKSERSKICPPSLFWPIARQRGVRPLPYPFWAYSAQRESSLFPILSLLTNGASRKQISVKRKL